MDSSLGIMLPCFINISNKCVICFYDVCRMAPVPKGLTIASQARNKDFLGGQRGGGGVKIRRRTK